MSITLQKIAGGLLFALMLIKVLDLIVDQKIPVHEVVASSGAEAPPPPAAPAVPDQPLPERLAAANVASGQKTAKACEACHTFNQGGATRVGPNLFGVVGRGKASEAGFAYSEGLKKKGGNWSYDDLDAWLTKPSNFAPGTKMGFAGLSSGQDRANVIAYLKSVSPDAPPFPGSGSGSSACGGTRRAEVILDL